MPDIRCPSCKKDDTLQPWEGPITLMGVELMAHGLRCRSCDETLFDFHEVERQESVIGAALVARGVRTGPEFKFIRKLAGLRANELAEMLDVRPETVSRWERGEVEIPRAVAYAIGEYYQHPRITRQKLEAFAR
jgi:putative zinc finger/helix-turn-helix YgiT family protein